jgi:outer membrane protein OmpA-like peptidoglycan-associated protein
VKVSAHAVRSKSRPLADNRAAEGRALSRRVEVEAMAENR